MPPKPKVKYVRLHRQLTNSWLTRKLPRPYSIEKAEDFCDTMLPEWEIVHLCSENPDEVV